MENVGAITFRGLDAVLGSLAEIGYDAEWQDIRASDVGAPHRRERIWIVAYPSSAGVGRLLLQQGGSQLAHSDIERCGEDVADACCHNAQGFQPRRSYQEKRKGSESRQAGSCHASARGQWATEPDVGRVAHGVLSRVDRLKCLGNSIVPQIAEMIFRHLPLDE